MPRLKLTRHYGTDNPKAVIVFITGCGEIIRVLLDRSRLNGVDAIIDAPDSVRILRGERIRPGMLPAAAIAVPAPRPATRPEPVLTTEDAQA